MNQPPPLPKPREKDPLVPVVITLACYPGLGQLMQHRWIVGGILTGLTTVSAAWLMKEMVATFIHSFHQTLQNGEYDMAAMFAPLARPAKIFGIIWLVCAVEILIFYWRQKRRDHAGFHPVEKNGA